MAPLRKRLAYLVVLICVTFQPMVTVANSSREAAAFGCEQGAASMAPIIQVLSERLKDYPRERSRAEITQANRELKEAFEKIEDKLFRQDKDVKTTMAERWSRDGVSAFEQSVRISELELISSSKRLTIWIAFDLLIKAVNDHRPLTQDRAQRQIEQECRAELRR